MVARITTSHRLSDAINYNEQKVLHGKAECLFAGNYLMDADEMNFYQKIKPLENRNLLNDRATTKTMHISLNFDPSENKITNDKLIEIGNVYMEKIGFGNQPFLLYRHLDAAHPHIHIVTTTIRKDGSRINTHNIGRNQSEKARKEIEIDFNLVNAERQGKKIEDSIRPIDIKAVQYGKDETRRSISNIVTVVMREYSFTSIPEYNTALNHFNILADQGKEGSRIHKFNGLVYRLLDETRNKVGVPIKASRLGGKPTLKKVSEKFEQNKIRREPHRKELIGRIEKAFALRPSSVAELIQILKKERIEMILRVSSGNRIYGITYLDLKSKSVFNGSDLGKEYAAAGILTRMTSYEKTKEPVSPPSANKENSRQTRNHELELSIGHAIVSANNTVIDELIMAERNFENTPYQLRKKKKRKKKKGPQNNL